MVDDSLGDTVVYGGASWDSPWLTEHHLARALARDHRVLFVDSLRSVATPLRRGPTRRAFAELGAMRRERLRAVEGLHVLRLLMPPPVSSARIRGLSAPLLRAQVAGAVDALGMRPRTVVSARTITEGVPQEWNAIRVSLVKDWLQASAHLTGLDPVAQRARELASWSTADLVLAISAQLQERLAEDGIQSQVLKHGFDLAAAPPPGGTPPHALATLPRPRIGALGRIDGRWAFDALGRLADEHPSGSLVLIGPVSDYAPRAELSALLGHPNVHQLPGVPSRDAQRWLGGLDCTLIPYLDDEWQRFASPLKVYDYLHAGAPIAATGSPAMSQFPEGLVEFALEPSELPVLVRRAMASDSPDLRARRRAYAASNTWDDRARELETYVAEARSPSLVHTAGSRDRP